MRHEAVQRHARQHFIYDPRFVDPLPIWFFDPDSLTQRELVRGTGTGRNRVWFFHLDGAALVLRHYWRGGVIARLTSDTYAWTGRDRTRGFREWRLLAFLRRNRLPVPTPVAARARRHGLVYRADLVTAAIPGAVPLDSRLRQAGLEAELWKRIGTIIGRFHGVGACHADLNVRNILLDEEDVPWLIDWDQGRLRRPARGWQQSNLDRLRRSLAKDPLLEAAARRGWESLLSGYTGV